MRTVAADDTLTGSAAGVDDLDGATGDDDQVEVEVARGEEDLPGAHLLAPPGGFNRRHLRLGQARGRDVARAGDGGAGRRGAGRVGLAHRGRNVRGSARSFPGSAQPT